MATRTIRLPKEKTHAQQLLLAEGIGITCFVAVVGSVRRDHGSFESRDRFGDSILRDVGSEHFLKSLFVARNGIEFLDHLGDRKFISMGFAMGPSACSSSVAARPSQNWNLLYPALMIVGALRPPRCP